MQSTRLKRNIMYSEITINREVCLLYQEIGMIWGRPLDIPGCDDLEKKTQQTYRAAE